MPEVQSDCSQTKVMTQLAFKGQCREAFELYERVLGGYAILGNDVPAHDYKPAQGFNIALHVETAGEARRIFNALSDGGSVVTPLSEVAWSSAFGIVSDRFGVPWLILALDK